MEKELAKQEKDTDSLRAYFNQIKDTPLLTFEQEMELSRDIQGGNEDARMELIQSNLKLVVKIAKAFKTTDMSLLDLIQEGNLGLMKAADKFDYRKNVRFSTYASWWIKQAIVRALSNKRRTIRLPHRKEEKLRKINKAKAYLSQKLMRDPEIHEIAQEIRLSCEEIEEILRVSSHIVSLDSEGQEDQGSLQEVLEDDSYDPNEELMKKSLREETMKFLDSLREKERKILMYRFSFMGGEKYTLKKIGSEMGISPETVRQIELRAINKLKELASDLKVYWSN
ncbi:MAG: sigma-70 family RNA polymerase sigma factor [Spirochaetales bacterium]|nr:sigma-70 family RNA polymerase sigma factor [Spirochaetales bacterium]